LEICRLRNPENFSLSENKVTEILRNLKQNCEKEVHVLKMVYIQGLKNGFFKKSPTQRVFWVLMGFIELWVFLGFFPMDKWVAPSRDSLDRMHLTLLTALLVVSFVNFFTELC